MREILFRGFHKDENGKQKVFVNGEWINGEWVYGYPVIDTGDCSLKAEGKCFCPHDGTSIFFWDDDFHEYTDCEIIPETVGQYTGLTDKNGMKIFEGDIVQLKRFGNFYRGKIVFNETTAGFEFWYEVTVGAYGEKATRKENLSAFIGACVYAEIIGNIHDDPELLDGAGNG